MVIGEEPRFALAYYHRNNRSDGALRLVLVREAGGRRGYGQSGRIRLAVRDRGVKMACSKPRGKMQRNNLLLGAETGEREERNRLKEEFRKNARGLFCTKCK